ncbi:DDE-type integrase/transposase/recombinase [Candidatus Bathyarchaeota archaeon]|nr:DDE-type integrase/transposase/recombinase [Candidatus Bathyarchaeota archaeon]
MERDSEKLKRWIIRKKLEGKPVNSICIQARISRKMFYYWWNRYQTQGWKGLLEKPKGRPCGPGLEDSLKEKIIKLRKRYEWGPNKIAGYLGHRGFTVDHHQVYSVICEAGLNHPIGEPRKTWGTKRFVREHNNSLWQADFKLCSDDWWMISYQDDHSRFITGSVKIWSPTGENAMLLLDRAVKRFGAPRQVLTDQGTQFKPARGETSAFDVHCTELGIEHITASVRRPTTCGKIEAFHKAYEVESHLFKMHWSFIRYYNYTRPHEGLNYLTPAEIYLKGEECNPIFG